MIPLRTCAACRRRSPRPELIRLRAVPGGWAAGQGPGRGAYVCRDERCIRRAAGRGSLARASATQVRDALREAGPAQSGTPSAARGKTGD